MKKTIKIKFTICNKDGREIEQEINTVNCILNCGGDWKTDIKRTTCMLEECEKVAQKINTYLKSKK